MIYFKQPQFPARYRIDGVDLYDVYELNRHGQMLQEMALADVKKKEWVGLTDEEREQVRSSCGYNQFMTAGEYADAVQKATETKLRERNA